MVDLHTHSKSTSDAGLFGGVRLVIDNAPRSGVENMTLDELILRRAIERDETTVRLYGWEEATVSLGYFQGSGPAALGEAVAEEAFTGLPTVRRLSGGGAILRHQEWTYSCAIPPGHPLGREPAQLYERLHDVIIREFAAVGIHLERRGAERAFGDTPFLCFLRGDERDLLCTGRKVVGSAQRRRKGAVLQHGSILLARSPHAAECPGIAELSGRHEPLNDELRSRLAWGLARAVGEPVVRNAFLNEERVEAAQWESTYRWGVADGDMDEPTG